MLRFRHLLKETQKQLWKMLAAYLDETGHSDDPQLRFAGMAGLVARSEEWHLFASRWQDTLNNAGLRESFHMVDFAGFQRQFRDWKSDGDQRRKRLLGRLVELILETKAIPVGALVSIEAFRSLTQDQQSSFKDPYFLAFQSCTRGAAVVGFPGEAVTMVYSYNKEYGAVSSSKQYSVDQAGLASQLWHTMKASTDYGQWMDTYDTGSPRDLPQLQAADLFAYELSKDFENALKKPDSEMRWALRQVLKLAKHQALPFITLYDRPELLRIIKESGWPHQDGVEELDDLQEISAMARMAKWFRQRGGVSWQRHVDGL